MRKIYRAIALALVIGTLVSMCTACGTDSRTWHEQQLDSGMKKARKIYKGY